MRTHITALISLFLVAPAIGHAQSERGPRVDERVAQIPQSLPGAPWSFIGYSVTPPAGPDWFVASGTPGGGTMGRLWSGTPRSAVLVLASEALERPVETDAALLELARARHARIGERWSVQRHDETAVRHAGTRCARHVIEGREPEDRSPRKDAEKTNAGRTSIHVVGLSCIHPTEPALLVEVAVSERSRETAMSREVQQEADALLSSLAFQRYSAEALRKSADAAGSGGTAAAEAVLKPYLEANAAWARYFMAQILERGVPAPDNVGVQLRTLLEPAAERGLSDAQWALGRLYLRGAPGLNKDPAKAEALLRRAAERGNPNAAFQLGLSLLSGADGITVNSRDAALWIQRAAFRGQKEAQELLAGAQAKPAQKGLAPAAPKQ